jgi:hypothetical protein
MPARTVQLKDIVLSNARLTKEAIEDGDFDTGCSDGSGNLTIRASSARQFTKRSVIFSGVTALVSNAEGSTKGYEQWSDASLQAEAESMLRNDYCQ